MSQKSDAIQKAQSELLIAIAGYLSYPRSPRDRDMHEAKTKLQLLESTRKIDTNTGL